ncbi:autotransporter outer membrane beta-barrel domain-containing protein [Candidatus Williamhamiltonella defendens]|uniref:Autotransporter outer membrane beta-barrel domain-containing protein n=1 Tax=Candidatus Hamiltonella defensa (Bemisia tabaci) TaxID=672795 RepID=A0A249DZU5_9ENTR|nr:autotransporter outer membrane beta-barrel domain-containing protein [Candidatus Hamiltonella defensa]ASX26775.1 autotransporter outer membrane beta-barrel domain-containing protein [Candidatus Hamiltonella defensa (Bemisia tabaci)]CED79234.1 Outer membrane autotransporter barrel domain protein [Candidatus Hamiltonella defensa (Bemisia tabaci)]
MLTLIIQSGPGFAEPEIFEEDTILKDKAYYPQGIEITNQAKVINEGALKVSASTAEYDAINVSNASTLTLKGEEDKSIQITVKDGIAGLSASDKDTKIHADKIHITGIDFDYGIMATEKAQININNSIIIGEDSNFSGFYASKPGTNIVSNKIDITTTKENSYGVKVIDGVNVDINNGTITGKEKKFIGLLAKGKNTTLAINNIDINVNDEKSIAVKAEKGAKVIFKGSNTITGKGDNIYGVWASGHGTNFEMDEMTITMNAEKGSGVRSPAGVRVSRGATGIIHEGSTITGTGNNFDGLWAKGAHSNLTASQLTINIHGDDSGGVTVQSGALISIDKNSSVTTTGALSHALRLFPNSTLKINDSHMETIKTDSAIVYGEPPDTEEKRESVLQIKGGSLKAGGDLILSKGGTIAVVLNNVITSPPGSGYALNVVDNGEINLEVKQTKLYGNILADNVSKASVSLSNESELNGWFKATNLSVDPTSTWSVTGHSILEQLKNEGNIVFTSHNNTFNTITTNDYRGNNGKIIFNTRLGGDDSPTDKLIINNNSKATTFVKVHNVGGKGAKTEEGIKIIEIKGKESEGRFIQDGRIVAGAYDYYLKKGSQSGRDETSWYLVSSRPEVPNNSLSTAPPSARAAPAPPAAPPVISGTLRPESLSYAHNLHASNTMFQMTLHERLGEIQYTQPRASERLAPAMWIRAVGGHHTASMSDTHAQSHRYVMMLGGEIAQWSSDGLNRYHVGFMGGYGRDQNTAHHDDNGLYSQGKVRGYSAGVYATWYQSDDDASRFYVDTWALYHWFDNAVTGKELPTESYKSRGLSASVESGYPFKVAEVISRSGIPHSFWVQPTAQLTWMDVKPQDHTETNGTLVTGRSGHLQIRLGLRAHLLGHSPQDEGKNREFEPFIEANWIHNLKHVAIRMNDSTHEIQGNRHIAEFKTGVEAKINEYLYLWGHVAHQIGKKSYRDTRGVLGVKYHF